MKSLEVSSGPCSLPQAWLQHKTALRQFILRGVGNKEMAEDLLQEVLLKTYAYCSSQRKITHMRSWLFRIAHNTLPGTAVTCASSATSSASPKKATVSWSFMDRGMPI